MIAYLNGRLDSKTPATAVVECGGVGYRCLIPLSTYDRLPATGENVKLLTCLVVREDAQTLYGFATEDEQQTFELVTSISGVGPKLALAILSGLTVGDLQLAIAEGNAKRLAAVKGIGKKTAERIVVELRGKINPLEAVSLRGADGGKANNAALHDTVLALGQLGFPSEVAAKMVQAALDSGADATRPDELLRAALAAR